MFEDPQSSDEECPIPDNNSCNEEEIKKLFKSAFFKCSEKAISLKRTCGLHLSLSNDGQKLAVGLSRKELLLYQLSANGELTQDQIYSAKYSCAIKGVKFFNNDNNLLMSCTEDGTVTLHDLRLANSVTTYEDRSEGPKKTSTAFDINQSDRVLCVSTDVQKNGDSFLLFYDIREREYMGSYWECHSEDITHVRFHPTNPDLFASGSVDGLINVFDISQPNEDDALQYCFNIHNAIETFNWHQSPQKKDWISCITTTNDFHLYDVASQNQEAVCSRQSITAAIRRTSSIDCNLIETHNDSSGFFLLAGSNYNSGECLRSLRYDSKCFTPHINFMHNKQIVRASVYNEKERCLITTGEGGLITVWRYIEASEFGNGNEMESNVSKTMKQNMHTEHRSRPY
ncbi:WD repeat-containing protein 89 isoform X2 [Malaya genurostris]|uniref:WD repeat-containing protein 89 isoform X2 n=1 Tax=Malaya genurostris TaxID=325434 RepID=UPI0026F3DA62|nr:WD repeat-containing protein 89 isoform X2 [Malaya genurostris]